MAGLESLGKIMCIELLELRRERDRAVASRTVAGHATNLLGYCLSVFCIARSAQQLTAWHPSQGPKLRRTAQLYARFEHLRAWHGCLVLLCLAPGGGRHEA